MANDYGQFEKRREQERQGQPVTSAGHAIDALLEQFTLVSYGVYSTEGDGYVEGIDDAQGFARKGKTHRTPQKMRTSGGLHVTNSAAYAEMQIVESEIWSLIRRSVERLGKIEKGFCISCGEPNDTQPTRRKCLYCEQGLPHPVKVDKRKRV